MKKNGEINLSLTKTMTGDEESARSDDIPKDLPPPPQSQKESPLVRTMSYVPNPFAKKPRERVPEPERAVEVRYKGDGNRKEDCDVSHKIPKNWLQLGDNPEEVERTFRRNLYIIAFLFLVVLILIIVLFVASGDSDREPESRLGDLEDILSGGDGNGNGDWGGIVTDLDILRDPSTPQYQAVWWLAFRDPANLDFSTASWDEIVARYVAAVLYFSTGGASWRVQYNFLSADPVCKWNDDGQGEIKEGIVCEDDDAGKVTQVVVDLNSLQGTLVTELASLRHLQTLGLASNQFVGTIPTEFGTMTGLVNLSLSGNELTGTLPKELSNLAKLENLRVHWNDLTGSVPESYSKLTALTTVHLEGNAIDGELDTSLCTIENEFDAFMADCAREEGDNYFAPIKITCSCCTECCVNGGNCQEV